MVDILFDRDIDSERYLATLNQVFGSWGGEEQFRWAFERDAGPGPANLMVLHEKGEWLAGSAVTYRLVTDAQGRSTTMGIMTGSWTLPAARGRGLFTEIIERSVALVAARGGSHLLAFVTHDNASRRRLEAAGAWMIPTSYIFSTSDTPRVTTSVEWRAVEAPDLEALRTYIEVERAGRAHFVYPDVNSFEGQFAKRPGEVRVLRSTNEDLAIVEIAGESARLQLFVPNSGEVDALGGLLGYAQGKQLRFFCFAAGDRTELAECLGLSRKEGFLTVLPAGPDVDREEPAPGSLRAWTMDSGDRM